MLTDNDKRIINTLSELFRLWWAYNLFLLFGRVNNMLINAVVFGFSFNILTDNQPKTNSGM